MKLSHYEWDPEKDLIAEGASAEIFKAKDTNSQNRYVALKIYKEAVSKSIAGSSSQKRYSLEKEFLKIDGLSHTNIISFYGLEYLVHQDAMGRSSSYPIIIMEYAREGTLHDLIKTKPNKDVINNIINDILNGIEYLHEEGIIHRDLKPGNILISKNRKNKLIAKITDFGISRDILSDQKIEQSFTEGVGTPHYMAPEQFYKKKFGLEGKVSEKTDIWAIGVVIYRLLTDKLPFANGSKDYEQVRDAIVNADPDYNGIPENFKNILIYCFQKEAVNRPKNIEEIRQLLKSQDNSVNKEVDELKTIIAPIQEEKVQHQEDDEATVIPSTETTKEHLTNKRDIIPKKTKTQNILVFIFWILNITGTLSLYIDDSNTPYVFPLAYLASITYVTFCFLKGKPLTKLWQFLIYGLLYFSVFVLFSWMVVMLIDSDKFSNWLIALYTICFHFLFIGWLSFKQLQFSVNSTFREQKHTLLIVSFSLILYLISYFLEVYTDTMGTYGVFIILLRDSFLMLTIVPNIFFLTAILVFLSDKKVYQYKNLILLFVTSMVMAALWWLFLDQSNGYCSTLIDRYDKSIYIPEFGYGYFFWVISMLIGFSAILHEKTKNTALKKYYWPFLVIGIIIWSASFNFKKFQSKKGYDYKNGIANLNISQLRNALNNGADVIWRPQSMTNVLEKYTNENSKKIEEAVDILISNGWKNNSARNTSAVTAALLTNNVSISKKIIKLITKKDLNEARVNGKSALKYALEMKNPELVKLILESGGKPKENENLFDINHSTEISNLLHKHNITNAFYYFDSFDEKGNSKKFKSSSDEHVEWSFNNGKYKFFQKKTNNKSSRKSTKFNIDLTKKYTIEVTTTSYSKDIKYGIVFDDAWNSFYTLAIDRDSKTCDLSKYDDEWTTVKSVPITLKTTNVLKLIRNGNYITCYLNEKLIIYNIYAKSFNANEIGVMISRPEEGATVLFDNFKITGTRK